MANVVQPIVRVLRVIEYIGTRDWVDKQIENRSLKGSSSRFLKGDGTITEAIIGETAEVLRSFNEQFCESRSQQKEDNK